MFMSGIFIFFVFIYLLHFCYKRQASTVEDYLYVFETH